MLYIWEDGDCMENELPNRKNLRLQNFDYSTPSAYFITVCTHDRKNTLSYIVGAIHESPETKLSQYGKIVDGVINNIPEHFKVIVERYVIMPNHIHLIIRITADEELRAIRESPLRGRSIVSKVVGYIKMNSSKEIHNRYGETKVWQRGFYDHIIRNQHDYEEISNYIYLNPTKWQADKLYREEERLSR